MDKREPETVMALTTRIKRMLESSFTGVWVEGELSNVKIMGSGHAYFSLKDSGAQIPCAFFNITRRPPGFDVKDGVKVRISGDVSVYESRGAYQLLVRTMERAGLGDLMAQFEALKKRLDQEGLFAQDHKRPLPLFPRKIGIVTSPTGAAIRDMLNVTRRRFANIHIVIAPARVQGAEGIPEIVAGIKHLNEMSEPPDVIIVGRGGGSIEDLWCFNEEAVARAIYHSAIPIISAVGHEIDFTIADFTADLRAPTPSAAAELVVGRKEEFETALATTHKHLFQAMRTALERAHARVDIAAGSHVFRRPETLVRQHAQHVDMLSQQMTHLLTESLSEARERLAASTPRMARATELSLRSAMLRISRMTPAMASAAKSAVAESRHCLASLNARLESVNPMTVLSRGYAMVKAADGTIIKTLADVKTGETLTTRLADGEFRSLALDGDSSAPRPPRRTRKPQVDQPTLL